MNTRGQVLLEAPSCVDRRNLSMNMQRSVLFEVPLAHELSSYQSRCSCPECLRSREFEMGVDVPSAFTPIAVERPGGGRIKDKRPPAPSDIVHVSGVGGRRIPLHRLAAQAWSALVAEARIDGIAPPLLLPVSGYRSPERQTALWQQALQRYGSPDVARRYVAPPGSSAHQSGRAIDFYLGGRNDSGNIPHLRTLPAYRWLVDHAEHYGFYPYSVEPWHWEYNPPASSQEMETTQVSTPKLIKRESRVPGLTLFVGIRLAAEGRARPMTGIFIPDNYRPQQSIDIILYLHGFKTPRNPRTKDNPNPPQPEDPGWSIDWYWRQRIRAFRERVNDSRKNVILIAPTLGQFSQTGVLTRSNGLDRYLDQVLAALVAHGPYAGQTPAIGNIILASHSGGGSPMRMLAMSNQGYTPLIRECWGFDCMYNGGDGKAWGDWASNNPNAKLYNYYRHTRERGTRAESQILQSRNLSNVTVVSLRPERISHDQVPITYWQTRIQATPFLLNI
jgi:D-alanyl-D-alanine carboxypeptidase